jgi:RNA polymerase sigma-70 factor (ECF subfamily)
MPSLYQEIPYLYEIAGAQRTEEDSDQMVADRHAGFTKSPASLAEPPKCSAPGTPHFSDEELVMLAQGGDTRAFSELVQRHFASCFKRALVMLRNRSDAEDEVQNAFSKAFECLSRFRVEGPFSAWLGRILQNQCRMLMRSRRQAGFVYVDAITESKARLELVDQAPDQEDELGTQQVDTLLKEQISRVPPLMRHVILLRDVEGLPMAEVAARLGLTLPAAKSRLMRARKEMRARLKKHCGQGGPRILRPKASPSTVKYTYVS